MNNLKAVILSDGSCLNNPGPAAIGAVVKTPDKTSLISLFIGQATNNIAEYQALIYALEEAKRLNASHIEAWMDSELVLNQLSGRFKVRDEGLIPLCRKARALLLSFSGFTLKKASRDENKQAHNLALKALRGTLSPLSKRE